MLNKHYRMVIIFLCLFSLLFVRDVFAHKIKIFAAQDGADITGTVYFPGGGKAHKVKVLVFDEANKQTAELITGENGEFIYTPERQCDYTFVVETEDGHKADFLLDKEEIPPDRKAAEQKNNASENNDIVYNENLVTQQISAIVSRQIRPLRDQIESYEESVRMRDIIGGIGYIFGILGLWALFLKKRDEKR